MLICVECGGEVEMSEWRDTGAEVLGICGREGVVEVCGAFGLGGWVCGFGVWVLCVGCWLGVFFVREKGGCEVGV